MPISSLFQNILLVISLLFLQVNAQSFLFVNYIAPTCSGATNQFFDTTTLRCVSCGTGQQRSADGLSCTCQSGYKLVSIAAGQITCEQCPAGQVTSRDGWSCVTCDAAIPPASGSAYCGTCPNPRTTARAEYDQNGNARASVGCVTCVDGTFVAPDGSHCIPCPRVTNMKNIAGAANTTCVCSGSVTIAGNTYQLALFGGVCFASTTAASSGPFVNLNVETQLPKLDGSSPVQSRLLQDNLAAAYGLCLEAYSNRTACQFVGSACALLLYQQVNVGSSTRDACNLFQELSARTAITNNNNNWRQGLPWLYLSAGSVLTSTEIPTRFTRLSQMPLLLAAFSQNGTFLGYRSASDGLLQLCPNSRSEVNAAYGFGTRYSSSCQLLTDDLFDQAKHPLVFYDIYLRVTSATGTEQLFPVPVKITNVRGPGGSQPNQLSNTNNFILTRRFFLVDNVGAVTSPGSRPEFVRYASKMTLEIKLINEDPNDRNGRIFPPLLTIEYAEVNSADFGTGGSVTASFDVTYSSDQQFFWEALRISMGVLCAIGGLYAIFRAFAVHNRSGGQNFEATVILHLIAFGCSAIANVFLIVIYGCAIWFFSTYKNQSVFAFYIPTSDQELNLIAYIAIAGGLKLIEIIYTILMQTRVDIFLMDWEKPKIESQGQAGKRGDGERLTEVTYWRTILVANEWNEIQTYRKTNRTFTLLTLLFVMNVLGIENYASGDPQLNRFIVADQYRSASVPTFRFALAVSVFIGIGGVQWLWTLLVHERFIEDKLRNFVDLCSLCNISVFIRYPRAFGYYIHGESPHSTADVGVTELHRQFEVERGSNCDRRGLDNSDNQTFMMRLPPNFLSVFDGLYRKLVETASSSAMGTPDAIHKYHEMNQFLIDFVKRKSNMRAGAESQVESFDVQPRKFIEDVVGLELGNNEQLQHGGIFYSEDGTSFGDVLFYGNEFSLITFDILLYSCVDLIFGSTGLNVIVTWLVGEAIEFLRQYLGEINLSRKTLTNRQFLI